MIKFHKELSIYDQALLTGKLRRILKSSKMFKDADIPNLINEINKLPLHAPHMKLVQIMLKYRP